MDNKKKYLKYKKKYLQIKKFRGGGWPVWNELVKKTTEFGSRMSDEWRRGVRLAPGKTVSSALVEAASVPVKAISYSYEKPDEKPDEWVKVKNETTNYLNEKECYLRIKEHKKKIFKLYKTNDEIMNTHFASRMGVCEGHLKGHSIASFSGLKYDIDRFIVVVNENPDSPWLSHKEGPETAQRLEYPIDSLKSPETHIYSDHDAISMPIRVGDRDSEFKPKLITFNLEGLCWGNNGEDEEWDKSIAHFLPEGVEPEHITSAGNEFRLENVKSLLKPYITPESGNIFLFQEVVLKNAAKADQEKKKSLKKLKKGLDIENMNYTLIHDGLTGAILYDNTQWENIEEINIERHYVNKEGETIHESDKKSNAYILKHIPSNMHIMVVNIHLMSTEEPDLRKSELAYIYHRVKTKSNDFEMPVYFGGDWNSEWTKDTKIDQCTLVEIDRIIEKDYTKDEEENYEQFLKHLES